MFKKYLLYNTLDLVLSIRIDLAAAKEKKWTKHKNVSFYPKNEQKKDIALKRIIQENKFTISTMKSSLCPCVWTRECIKTIKDVVKWTKKEKKNTKEEVVAAGWYLPSRTQVAIKIVTFNLSTIDNNKF